MCLQPDKTAWKEENVKTSDFFVNIVVMDFWSNNGYLRQFTYMILYVIKKSIRTNKVSTDSILLSRYLKFRMCDKLTYSHHT